MFKHSSLLLPRFVLVQFLHVPQMLWTVRLSHTHLLVLYFQPSPQAVTYFAPTELAIGAVEEAAREAGFTDSEIEALARTFSDPQLNPQTELDSRARDVV